MSICKIWMFLCVVLLSIMTCCYIIHLHSSNQIDSKKFVKNIRYVHCFISRPYAAINGDWYYDMLLYYSSSFVESNRQHMYVCYMLINESVSGVY